MFDSIDDLSMWYVQNDVSVHINLMIDTRSYTLSIYQQTKFLFLKKLYDLEKNEENEMQELSHEYIMFFLIIMSHLKRQINRNKKIFLGKTNIVMILVFLKLIWGSI